MEGPMILAIVLGSLLGGIAIMGGVAFARLLIDNHAKDELIKLVGPIRTLS